MSETQETAAASAAAGKPAAEGVADAVRDAAVRGDRAGTFPARIRAGLRRPRRRDRRDHPRSVGAGFCEHHHRAGALRKTALQGVGGVLRPGVGAFQPGAARDRQGGVARMARHWNPIMMNAVLFGRIAMLHENRATLGLTAEQTRLLERTYTRFHRAGAGLDDAAKTRMAEINERLAHLGTAFSHHLLGDEQDWFMELGEADRDGLPDSFVAAAKAAAGERGMAGKAIVTLSRSSVEPFLKSSARRDLREKVYQGLHRARRQRQRQRQQRRHRRDPAAARGEREAAGLSDLRRLSAGGFDGQDAGGRARPAGAGLEAGARPGAQRIATTCRRWLRRRAAISRWRPGTGATTPKSCGSAAPISTTPRSSPIWRSIT